MRLLYHREPILQFHDASRYVWDDYFVPHWDQCVFSDQPFVESVSTVGVLRDVFTDRGGHLMKADGELIDLDVLSFRLNGSIVPAPDAPAQSSASASSDHLPVVPDWVQ